LQSGANPKAGKNSPKFKALARIRYLTVFARGSQLNFPAGKHISIFMRTTFDLPDDLMKRAKIAAVQRGSTLRDFVAEALRRLLAEQPVPKRRRMTEAPIKLPPGHTIPIRSNIEIAQLFDQDDITHLNDVYRGR
jgi:Arc/MetJ family transcription regulator